MSYGETKVYFDGSHYIAIPHTEKPYKKRRKFVEEEIIVTETETNEASAPTEEKADSPPSENTAAETEETIAKKAVSKPVKTVVTTKKQLFDKLYAESLNLPKSARK